ncbi:response regulator [Ideonella paludis]|uniref:Response regulator transcription factor n=1 Tax=Ideonella paludis TaxID=1233411 RepID=A0ABS5DV72_9BURK|nr:response regulator transcription factor [Ideonella paludis]MBQ0935047.1 response regulator transcription factor [Ideonella paludis]
MKLLLIEDDLDIGAGIQRALQQHDLTVVWVRTLASAMTFKTSKDFDLAVLDLGLPDGDGLTWLTMLRAQEGLQPVMILSARDSLRDRLDGLKQGADDFLVKPFELEELIARLQAMIRRLKGFTQSGLRGCGLEIDHQAHLVYLDGQVIHLSRTEFQITQLLLQRIGRVVPRNTIEELALSNETASSLDMHMSNLRKKLGRQQIRTVRGIGFVIDRSDSLAT